HGDSRAVSAANYYGFMSCSKACFACRLNDRAAIGQFFKQLEARSSRIETGSASGSQYDNGNIVARHDYVLIVRLRYKWIVELYCSGEAWDHTMLTPAGLRYASSCMECPALSWRGTYDAGNPWRTMPMNASQELKMSQRVKIDFVSDISCPWCAVGLGSLKLALARLEGVV